MSFYFDHFARAKQVIDDFVSYEKEHHYVEKSISLLVHTFKKGGRVYSCGNGGSMCDAIHFAEELSGRYRDDRPALPALAISDPGHISCVGNDYGYDSIFSRFLEGHGQNGDTLLAISTSGNSANVLKAIEVAKQKKMTVIGLLGKDGGKIATHCDIPIIVPANETERIQEIHIKIIHCFIEGIERQLYPQIYR
jgi:D-sedoheptulose 7-phosphate isomerase